ncbi:MAG TPA: pilin [Candidatus Saccharimonadales bacterium]|nr:pilin [Candidatus Saccharimonadales bacterium]
MFRYIALEIIHPDRLPQNSTCSPQTSSTCTTDNIATIIGIIFVIIGALALLMIVIAGLRYIFAQGDPNKMAEAKNQIQYSLIGLIIASLAYAIVGFITGKLG